LLKSVSNHVRTSFKVGEKDGNGIVFGAVFYFLNLPLKILIFPIADHQEIWA